MTSITFDKLTYIETLKSAGIADEHARAHTHALDDALRDSVATKADVKELDHKIVAMEQRIIIKVGAMFFTGIGFLAALQFFAK